MHLQQSASNKAVRVLLVEPQVPERLRITGALACDQISMASVEALSKANKVLDTGRADLVLIADTAIGSSADLQTIATHWSAAAVVLLLTPGHPKPALPPGLPFPLTLRRDATTEALQGAILKVRENARRAASGSFKAARPNPGRHDLLDSILEGLEDGLLLIDTAIPKTLKINPLGRALLQEIQPAFREDALDQILVHERSLLDIANQALHGPVEEEVHLGPAYGPRVCKISARALRPGAHEVLLTLRDITHQHRLEQALIHMDRLSSLGQLTGTLAHELNNPLSYLLLTTNALEAAVEDPSQLTTMEMKDSIDALRKGLERFQGLVAGLKKYSAKPATDYVATPLRTVVEEALRIASPQLAHVARVQKEYAEGVVVAANADLLIQVFVNLILNATQALSGFSRKKHNLISVGFTADAEMAYAWVKDNGPGISPELKEHIFEAFLTTKGEGTGLGLSISRDLVEKHGGRIWCESSPGKGASFRLSLPAWRQARQTAKNRGHADPKTGTMDVFPANAGFSGGRVATPQQAIRVPTPTSTPRAVRERRRTPTSLPKFTKAKDE